jgi:hypothetical protein
MNLAKLIAVLEFGFITKVTPNGFHTVQTTTDIQGEQIYWDRKFVLYNTLEDYPKYNRFVLSTFLWITLLGHIKEYFMSGHIRFKLKQMNLNKYLSNYWLVLHGNQRHPRYNNWYRSLATFYIPNPDDEWENMRGEAEVMVRKTNEAAYLAQFMIAIQNLRTLKKH